MSGPSQLSGQLLGHYRIVEQIGVGGAGEVYRAFDERLHREVAIKVLLRGAVADGSARQRFRNEALALSSLNHPNIATIFDFDYEQGMDFIVMEFISGCSLAEKLAMGPLVEKEALSLGVQILEGLREAHAHGMAHHDLKPSNLMVTNAGHLKILDFGLAKLIQPADKISTQSHLQIKEFAGTLPYMAPEVLRGDVCDTRIDIWSFGVVFFQMTTGKLPFDGHTPFEISSAILRGDPPKIPTSLPFLFKTVLSTCLARDPTVRFPTAGAVLDSLQGDKLLFEPPILSRARRPLLLYMVAFVLLVIGLALYFRRRETSQVPPLPLNLAILPLTSSPEPPEVTAFGNGLVETLTVQMGKLGASQSVHVIPITEARSKGVVTTEDAAREFGAQLGLAVGVHRAGEMIRVNYLLVEAKTHKQLAGDTITAPISDPFELEDRVARSVTRALQLRLDPGGNRIPIWFGTSNPAAYQLYLQGRGYLQEQHNAENIEKAIVVFRQALSQDAAFAEAYAGLGESYWNKYEMKHDPTLVKLAIESCKSSIQLQAQSAEAYICLGTVFNGTGQYVFASEQFKKAFSIDSSSDTAIAGLAAAYQNLGDRAAAESAFIQAIQLRPQYWRNYNMLGAFYIREARYDRAADMFREVTRLSPDGFRGYSNLGGTYIYMGNYADAIVALGRSLEIRPTGDAYSNLATSYFHLRRFEDAVRTYKKAIELEPSDYTLQGNMAAALYYSGHSIEAADAYKHAIALAEKQIAVNPRDASLLSDLGGYHSMLRERKAAIELTSSALILSPRDPNVLFQAALVYSELGDANQAIALLRKAFEVGYSRNDARDSPVLDKLRTNPEVTLLLSNPQ